jgi:hypothetical protein
MSIVDPERTSRRFLTVVCPCGRNLRAPLEQAGQEISCWECHRSVRVPMPKCSPERCYQVITDGLPEVYEPRWLVALFVYTAVVTGVLIVPDTTGAVLATVVLGLGALGYGELIRQCGVDFWDFDDWKRPVQLLQRIAVAALFGLFVASPLLLAPGGFGHPPRFTTLRVILGLAATLVIPLLMFLIFARDDAGPLGWRRGVHVLIRYPVATCLSLTLLPIGVVAAELLFVGVSSWVGMFRYLLLELYPDSVYYGGLYGIEKYFNYTRPVFPDSHFWHLYLRRLYQGYSFTASLPGSLSGKTFVMGSLWTLELTDTDYLRIRAIYSQVTTMVLFFFAALQARWLGAISTLESRRSLEVIL